MEKRQYPRFAFSEPVSYQHTEGSQELGSMGEDISQGGVRIRVNEFLPLLKILNLRLHLNNPSRVLDVKGQVVWVRELPLGETFDVGIRFLEIQKNVV